MEGSAAGRWARGGRWERARGRLGCWRAGGNGRRDGWAAGEDWVALGWAQEKGKGGDGPDWVGKLGLGLLWVFPFLFLFLFYFSLKLNYLNSKEILNSNPYEIKQLKPCISMNASTKLNLRKFLITCETKIKLYAILTQ